MKQQKLDFGELNAPNKDISSKKLFGLSSFITKKNTPKPSLAFDTFWRFAHIRQSAFYNKIHDPNSLTFSEDPILRKHRFTNVFRASDRVSQFLISEVQYNKKWSFEDTIFRTLLFKIFNKIETWQMLENSIGDLTWRNGILDEIRKTLDKEFSSGVVIYSAAYIIPSPKSAFGHDRKHRNHIDLIDLLMKSNFLDLLHGSKSLEILYQHLKSLPGLGAFLAYQYAIDLNYSEHFGFSENDFVQPGPGALDGIQKCFDDFGDYTPADIIKLMVDFQHMAFEALELPFKNLWGRPLHLIDCQNLFCETDKYCRVAHPEIVVGSGRSRIKQIYRSSRKPLNFAFPTKWNLNTEMPL